MPCFTQTYQLRLPHFGITYSSAHILIGDTHQGKIQARKSSRETIAPKVSRDMKSIAAGPLSCFVWRFFEDLENASDSKSPPRMQTGMIWQIGVLAAVSF